MLRAHISPCVGLSSWVLLPNPLKHKNTTLLSDDSSKTWGLDLLHLQKNFYQHLGRQHFSPSSPAGPHAKPTRSVVSRPMLLPLIQFFSWLVYLHTKLHFSLLGSGQALHLWAVLSRKELCPSAGGQYLIIWCEELSRKSLPQWLVNVRIQSDIYSTSLGCIINSVLFGYG